MHACRDWFAAMQAIEPVAELSLPATQVLAATQMLSDVLPGDPFSQMQAACISKEGIRQAHYADRASATQLVQRAAWLGRHCPSTRCVRLEVDAAMEVGSSGCVCLPACCCMPCKPCSRLAHQCPL
jgi:hypothetical protein